MLLRARCFGSRSYLPSGFGGAGTTATATTWAPDAALVNRATSSSVEMSAWLLWNLDDDHQLRQRLPLLAALFLE
ncbi:hypothetical protein [Micromonospora kangleipakensis]|uniref:hypothetical protein n=1 Tax=Micromonospora kangleipakensis TaxID=1077942 RepID=UPI0010288FCE|nr:hypothetical protein [Micromonospora kangleipakensis]